MKGFLSCNHPVKVNTLKGVRLVACGHCIQCKTAKRRKTELLLSLETQQNRYCELINHTHEPIKLSRNRIISTINRR